jgi:uncharacterized protein YciI
MFIVELTYKVPLETIDANIDAHIAFLEKNYEAGHFIVSGRKVPRDGGIIIAVAESKLVLADILAEDPFYKLQLADYRITEFHATRSTEQIASFFSENT